MLNISHNYVGDACDAGYVEIIWGYAGLAGRAKHSFNQIVDGVLVVLWFVFNAVKRGTGDKVCT